MDDFESKLRAIREDAIDILQQAGFMLSFESSNPLVRVVCDSIEMSYSDDRVEFTVDGQDLTGLISHMTIVLRPGQYPVFNVNLWPKGIKTLNTPDEQLGTKLKRG